jgi:O-antigen/teichoic acid export membrane protein
MLKQKLILSYSTKIGLQVLQIVASLVVARVAGPTVLGTVAFGTAYVSILVFISDLGISTAHIKLLSEGEDEDKCVSTFAGLKVMTTLLFILGVLGFYSVQKYVFGKEFESQAHEYVIFISLVTVTLQQLIYIPKTTFMARTEQAKVDIPDLLGGFLQHPLRIVIVLLGFGAVALSFANMASVLVLVPVYIYLTRNLSFKHFDKKLAMRYLRISMPVILIGMSTSMIQQVDKVLLQFFTSSEQVGYYTAGFKVGGFILLIGKSVGLLFFPLFSKAVAEGNRQYIRDKIYKFERFSFLFLLPGVLLLAIYSRTIIMLLLGDQYLPSVYIMQVVTVALFINVLNMPYGSVIEGLGKFKLSAILNTVNLIFFAGMIVIFLHPQLVNTGAAGVANAVLLTNIFLGILYRFYATKNFPSLSHKLTFRFVPFAIVNFYVFYAAYEYLFYDDLLLQIAFVPVYMVLTYTALTLLGWIDRDDLGDLMSIVDFKSMKNYIVKEIKKR